MPAGKPRALKEKLELNGLADIHHRRYDNRAKTSDLPLTKITAIPCPKKYSKETAKAWDAIVPGLLKLGVVSEIDLPSLGMMFDAYEVYAKYRNKEKELQAKTDWESEYSIKLLQKAATLKRGAYEDFVKMSARFGVTPVERTRLEFNIDEKKPADPLALVLGEGK